MGIPCVLDRLIQQAILQVLQWRWDATFSEFSYGFRPGRNAHQAVAQAQAYIEQGYHVVVDIDLEKFFDQVCHDRLMSRLAERITDKRLLKLIRAYLQAGILEDGLVTQPEAGTPQGSSLSPFLSNVVLDELDKQLEARGHRFCRYADDSNIYVRSTRAGERVMASARVPLYIMVINNYSGAIFHFFDLGEAGKRLQNPHEWDFRGLAENFRLAYVRPSSPAVFLSAYQEAQRRQCSTLFELVVDGAASVQRFQTASTTRVKSLPSAYIPGA